VQAAGLELPQPPAVSVGGTPRVPLELTTGSVAMDRSSSGRTTVTVCWR
jgi:hypothetical protein